MKIKKVFGDDKRMSLENESRAKKKHWSHQSSQLIHSRFSRPESTPYHLTEKE